jgi:Ras-related protein Rab-6A
VENRGLRAATDHAKLMSKLSSERYYFSFFCERRECLTTKMEMARQLFEPASKSFKVMNQLQTFKVVFLGDCGVGKTTILRRFMTDTFTDHLSQTVREVSYQKDIQVGREIVKLDLWDTAGQDKYAAESTFIIRNAACCVVCYSVDGTQDAKNSFGLVETFIKRYQDLNQSGFVVIAANKSDTLQSDEEELAQLEELKSKHEKFVRQTFLTSAKFGQNIKELFNCVAQELLLSSQATFTTSAPLQIARTTKEESSCC